MIDVHALAMSWGNRKHAAPEDFAEAIVEAWHETQGTVLECGSGFTTLVLNALTEESDRRVMSLEMDPVWYERVAPLVPGVYVHLVDCVNSWYDYSRLGLDDVGLVVCDGPPGNRHKLMSIRDRMRDDCLILVDDARRDMAMIERWGEEYGCQFEIVRGSGRGIGRVWWKR